ncbi:hypothetical protein F511_26501 [Dorcoceras hygrometricum]|uniref:Uncharacterized protein n=1 Tax=Dorcoceras hygrometricum TaxID=472368 RepID=A0A2Z7APG3_9LAMI|nr:hypothetical protein F511_26501 [Dorcoceras hygrometricum]
MEVDVPAAGKHKPAAGRHGSAVVLTRCINQLQRKEEFEAAVALRKIYELLEFSQLLVAGSGLYTMCRSNLLVEPSEEEEGETTVFFCRADTECASSVWMPRSYFGWAISSPGARLGDSTFDEIGEMKENLRFSCHIFFLVLHIINPDVAKKKSEKQDNDRTMLSERSVSAVEAMLRRFD